MKLKLGLYLIVCSLFLSTFVFAETVENLIENYDLRSYSPQTQGLKDLYFQVNVPGLTEMLNQELRYGKLENVHFEVYWQSPDKFQIEVQGMPNGFYEKKTALINSILGYLGFVLPSKFAPKLSGYAMSLDQNAKGYLVRGEDKSNVRGVNKLELQIDQEGKVDYFKIFSATGVQTYRYIYKARTWSNNKWVLDRVVTETIHGFNRIVSDMDIRFIQVSGFGLPETIKVSTKAGLNNGKELDSKTEVKLELQFGKYEVNTGKANKYFTKAQSKKR